MTLEFVPATENDRGFYRHVHHLAYRPDIEKMFGWDEALQDKFADKDFDTRNPTLVYFNKNKVGVIGWLERENDIWFGPVFILPEFQGQGIGTLILKHFMTEAEHRKIPLSLQTLAVNERAKKWYETLGFHTIEKSAIHWQMQYKPK